MLTQWHEAIAQKQQVDSHRSSPAGLHNKDILRSVNHLEKHGEFYFQLWERELQVRGMMEAKAWHDDGI